jgi:hypothetical protein
MVDDFDALLTEFLKPKQILFLSADLVGSTAMKQKRDIEPDGTSRPDSKSWEKSIQLLYSVSVSLLEKEWNRKKKNGGNRNYLGDSPILWKTIGDEIIFRKYISNHREVRETIGVWTKVVKDIEAQFHEIPDIPHLRIKATSWLGEFPIQNKVLISGNRREGEGSSARHVDLTNPIERLEQLANFEKTPVPSGLEIDFIGPAIDIGFRLAKLSTARKYVVSIDTAYLLILAGGPTDRMEIRYDGRTRIPGLFNTPEYPVFWIDMAGEGDSEKIEDKLLGRPTAHLPDVIAFCEKFYEEKKTFIYKPFIPTDEHEPLQQHNLKWHDAETEHVRSDWLQQMEDWEGSRPA